MVQWWLGHLASSAVNMKFENFWFQLDSWRPWLLFQVVCKSVFSFFFRCSSGMIMTCTCRVSWYFNSGCQLLVTYSCTVTKSFHRHVAFGNRPVQVVIHSHRIIADFPTGFVVPWSNWMFVIWLLSCGWILGSSWEANTSSAGQKTILIFGKCWFITMFPPAFYL